MKSVVGCWLLLYPARPSSYLALLLHPPKRDTLCDEALVRSPIVQCPCVLDEPCMKLTCSVLGLLLMAGAKSKPSDAGIGHPNLQSLGEQDGRVRVHRDSLSLGTKEMDDQFTDT
ncbi:hypothetical protein LIA77_08376 [Sarocladium implicatum]|nr:hypothetical protein LIA77_08376 [Sarocladium implicatum]